MKPADVLVVGSGMAGLVAALAASKRGRRVRLVARGAGALAIGSGCVDVLGYLEGKAVQENPLNSLSLLPEQHPYRLVGHASIKDALNFFTATCAESGLCLANESGGNIWAPTVLGTFKPTWLCPPGMNRETLVRAETIAIASLPWLKDVHSGMVRTGLQKQKRLQNKPVIVHEFSPYAGRTHRNLTILDTARFVDTADGERWLTDQLLPLVERARQEALAILVPPILGITRTAHIRQALYSLLGCPLVEMLSPPPGVGGLRIRQALVAALAKEGVYIEENTHIIAAKTESNSSIGRCVGLVSQGADRQRVLQARSYIIATGGFLGGGLHAAPGKAHEAIFGLDLGAPDAVTEWSSPDIFSSQPYARLGVRADASLRAVAADNTPLWENVFFAGRSLAGYDPVTEKNGNGVALATGYHAGMQV